MDKSFETGLKLFKHTENKGEMFKLALKLKVILNGWENSNV